MKKTILGFLLLAFCTFFAMQARAAEADVYCQQSGVTPPWQPWSASNPCQVTVSPGNVTLVPLDVSTVTTGGTAVTALSAGHRSAGGWLQNPPSATVNLCINEIGTASGTTSAGNTTCIVPGQTYVLAPSGNGVSVISSDNSHAFAGQGWQ